MATTEELEDTHRLQGELQRVIDDEDPVLACSALTYVLVSTVAEHAKSLAAAERAIDLAVAGMKVQLQVLGVGRRHQ